MAGIGGETGVADAGVGAGAIASGGQSGIGAAAGQDGSDLVVGRGQSGQSNPSGQANPGEQSGPSGQNFAAEFKQSVDASLAPKDSGDIVLGGGKKSKRGVIVGVAMVALVLLAGVAGAAAWLTTNPSKVSNVVQPYPDGMTTGEIDEILTTENIDKVESLESWATVISAQPLYLNVFIGLRNGDIVDQLDEALETYNNLYMVISQYDAVQYRDGTPKYFSNAKGKMSTMLPVYENLVQTFETLYEFVYGDVEIETVAALPGYDEAFLDDVERYNEVIQLLDEYTAMECTGYASTDSEDCTNVVARMNEMASDNWKFDLRKILLASVPKDTKIEDNLALQDLRSIQLAPENKAVEVIYEEEI